MKTNANQHANQSAMGAFEKKFFKALREKGLTIPITNDEIRAFDKQLENDLWESGDSIIDVDALLARGLSKPVKVMPLNPSDDQQISDSLAQVAREGKTLSPEVLARMEEDRAKAESEANKKGDA
jgi:hypothetical protein